MLLVSAAAFGLFHLPNALAGQALDATLGQVFYAFVMGCALYISMRLAGSILLPVALHALWDFSVFSSKGVDLSVAGGRGLAGGIVAARHDMVEASHQIVEGQMMLRRLVRRRRGDGARQLIQYSLRPAVASHNAPLDF